jgi:hypothetical protein
MKPGDILLFKAEKDFLSRLITWGTGSIYSHVAICVSPRMNLAIEAMTKDTISYLVSKLNSKYDYFGVIFLGILKLLAKEMKLVEE